MHIFEDDTFIVDKVMQIRFVEDHSRMVFGKSPRIGRRIEMTFKCYEAGPYQLGTEATDRHSVLDEGPEAMGVIGFFPALHDPPAPFDCDIGSTAG